MDIDLNELPVFRTPMEKGLMRRNKELQAGYRPVALNCLFMIDSILRYMDEEPERAKATLVVMRDLILARPKDFDATASDLKLYTIRSKPTP